MTMVTPKPSQPPPQPPPPPSPQNEKLTKEEEEILSSLGLSLKSLSSPPSSTSTATTTTSSSIHPLIAAGLATAFVFNLGLLLSLPPVLRGKGAPYLPTFDKNLDATFDLVRKQLKQQQRRRQRQHRGALSSASLEHDGRREKKVGKKEKKTKSLQFVDLGSGDGRVVFRAAREGLFDTCVGYEINPVLHIWAYTRRILQYTQYHSTTKFYLANLWNVNLSNANVIAIYGLQPIMAKLGNKMKQECNDGCIVVSNVFEIPGWKPSSVCRGGNVHLYCIPDCWDWNGEDGTSRLKDGGDEEVTENANDGNAFNESDVKRLLNDR